jgi:hypothetical protein
MLGTNPLSPILLTVGGCLIFSGLSLGTLKAVIVAQRSGRPTDIAIDTYLLKEFRQIPEDFVTTCFTLVSLHALKKIMDSCQKGIHNVKHKLNCYSIDRENRYQRSLVDKQNRILLDTSKKEWREAQTKEILERHHLPLPEKTRVKGDFGVEVRWRVDRAKYGDAALRDIPEAPLVYEQIKTGEKAITSYVWHPGYYDKTFETVITKDPVTLLDVTTVVEKPVWVAGYYDTVTTYDPIMEPFFGYNLSTREGWEAPLGLATYPAPLPHPEMPPLGAPLVPPVRREMAMAPVLVSRQSEEGELAPQHLTAQ